jgi:hypothetical protein
MGADDVDPDDMLESLNPFAARPAALTSEELDGLLAGQSMPLAAGAEARRLDAHLAALRGPAAGGELTIEGDVLAAYTNGMWDLDTLDERAPAVVSSTFALRVGVVAISGAVLFGGVAAAATGSLPTQLQQAASRIGAPSPSERSGQLAQPPSHGMTAAADRSLTVGSSGVPSPGPTAEPPVGPDATGPAAFGLCQAYASDDAMNPDTDPNSLTGDGQVPSKRPVAHRNLAAAAEAAGLSLDAYCHDVALAKATATAAAQKAPSARGNSGDPGRPFAPPTPGRPGPATPGAATSHAPTDLGPGNGQGSGQNHAPTDPGPGNGQGSGQSHAPTDLGPGNGQGSGQNLAPTDPGANGGSHRS